MGKKLAFLFLLLLLLAGCGSVQASASPKAITFPKDTPHFAGPLYYFSQHYGVPNNHSDPKSNTFAFGRYAGTQKDAVVLRTAGDNPQVSAQHVFYLVLYSYQVGWARTQALNICRALLPSDAHPLRHFAYSWNSNFEEMYTSASLKPLFPNYDYSGAAPGTISIYYVLRDDGSVDRCLFLLGVE